MTQLKGPHTSRVPGVPASAAFAAFVSQWPVSVVVLPGGNTETEEPQHLDRIPGRAVEVLLLLPVPVPVCAGNTNEVEQKWTHVLNRPQKSTPGIQA